LHKFTEYPEVLQYKGEGRTGAQPEPKRFLLAAEQNKINCKNSKLQKQKKSIKSITDHIIQQVFAAVMSLALQKCQKL